MSNDNVFTNVTNRIHKSFSWGLEAGCAFQSQMVVGKKLELKKIRCFIVWPFDLYTSELRRNPKVQEGFLFVNRTIAITEKDLYYYDIQAKDFRWIFSHGRPVISMHVRMVCITKIQTGGRGEVLLDFKVAWPKMNLTDSGWWSTTYCRSDTVSSLLSSEMSATLQFTPMISSFWTPQENSIGIVGTQIPKQN